MFLGQETVLFSFFRLGIRELSQPLPHTDLWLQRHSNPNPSRLFLKAHTDKLVLSL